MNGLGGTTNFLTGVEVSNSEKSHCTLASWNEGLVSTYTHIVIATNVWQLVNKYLPFLALIVGVNQALTSLVFVTACTSYHKESVRDNWIIEEPTADPIQT